MTSPVFAPLTLPNGATLPNRIAKAAMEESLAGEGQLPGAGLLKAYELWAKGGTGTLITGNVMVDARALTSPAAAVLEAGTPLEPYRAWAKAAKDNGARIIMQISHPGRQAGASAPGPTWAPSAIALDLGKNSKYFKPPVAMSEAQVRETIGRFADTAAAAEQAGFDGVQIHAAHGYLVSQFLSPLANKRDDSWGGSLENRARLLIEIVKAVRARVAPGFIVAVKLNSADFQRGGFTEGEAEQVVRWLGDLGVDLVELSGGSYEAPAMQGNGRDGRTLAREAFFLEFAAKIATVSRIPLMTTGGIRRLAVAEEVLKQGVAVVGMATALAQDPDLPNEWRRDAAATVTPPDPGMSNKGLAGLAIMSMVKRHIHALARGDSRPHSYHGWYSLMTDLWGKRRRNKVYRAWLAGR